MGFKKIDELTLGLMADGMSNLIGDNGSGKTVSINNITLNAIDAGENVFKYAEIAIRRHKCTLMVIDNLMTVLFDRTSNDFYRKQANFICRL